MTYESQNENTPRIATKTVDLPRFGRIAIEGHASLAYSHRPHESQLGSERTYYARTAPHFSSLDGSARMSGSQLRLHHDQAIRHGPHRPGTTARLQRRRPLAEPSRLGAHPRRC